MKTLPTPQSSCAVPLFGKSFPRSDQRPWLEFLVLHINGSEDLKYCCTAQQIIKRGFHTGFWQPALWPVSLLCMLRIFLTANENILLFFQVFLWAEFSSRWQELPFEAAHSFSPSSTHKSHLPAPEPWQQKKRSQMQNPPKHNLLLPPRPIRARCVWGPKKSLCKTTWNYLSIQQPDQNEGFEFCKLGSFPYGCFCCCLVLRILWEKWMECISAVVLSVLFFGFGEILTGEILLVIFIIAKDVCVYPWNVWRWLENWWISSCGVRK